MSASPPSRFKAKRPDPGQIAGAVSAIGVSDDVALQLETALRAAAQGSPITSYELEELPDGSVKFTVIVGPAVD